MPHKKDGQVESGEEQEKKQEPGEPEVKDVQPGPEAKEEPPKQEPPKPETPDEKHFREAIDKEASRRNAFTDQFIEAAKKRSRYSKYEQSKFDQKRMIGDMARYYALLTRNDQNMQAILKDVKALSLRSDNAYTGSVKEESKSYNEILDSLAKYIKALDEDEIKIHAESESLFCKKKPGAGEDEPGEWMSQEDIEKTGDPDLIAKNRSLAKQLDENDKKRSIAIELENFLTAERDGKLFVDQKLFEGEDKHHYVDGRGLNFYTRFDTGSSVMTWGSKFSYQRDQRDRALFSHEMSSNDIAQGMLGDCYFVQALSSIARQNPELIKEMICDNGDGSATVRLFNKSKTGEYDAIYVRLDKVAPVIGLGFTEGLFNSVAGNCFERAAALLGINSSANENYDDKKKRIRTSWTSIPSVKEVQDAYKRLKEKERKKEPFTEKDFKENPWLFNSNYKLMPWPNYESLNGGNGGNAFEMLLGPGYGKYQVEIPKEMFGNPRLLKAVKEEDFSPLRLLERALIPESSTKKEYEFAADKETLFSRFRDRMLPNQPDDSPGVKMYRNAVYAALEKIESVKRTPEMKYPTDWYRVVREAVRPSEEQKRNAPASADADEANRIAIASAVASGINGVISATELNEAGLRKKQELYDLVKEAERKGAYVSAGSRHNSPDGKPLTIASGHVYSIIGAYTDEKSGKQYLRLRNPWGERNGIVSRHFGGVALVEKADGSVTFGKDSDAIFDIDMDLFLHDVEYVDANGLTKGMDRVAMSGRRGEILFRTTEKEEVGRSILRKILQRHGDEGTKVQIPNDSEEITKELFVDTIRKMNEYQNGNVIDEAYADLMANAAGRVYDAVQTSLDKVYRKPDAEKPLMEQIQEELTAQVKTFRTERDTKDKPQIEKVTAQKANSILTPFTNNMERFFAMENLLKTTEKIVPEIIEQLEKPEGERPRLFLADDPRAELSDRNNLPEITGFRKEEDGEFVFSVWDGKSTTEYYDYALCNNFSQIIVREPEVKAPEIAPEEAPKQDPVNIVETADFVTVGNYFEALENISSALTDTDFILSHDSEEYVGLKDAVNQAIAELAQCSGRSMDKIDDAMGVLRESVGRYETHCLEKAMDDNGGVLPKDEKGDYVLNERTLGVRRNARLKICNVLRKVCDSAAIGKDDPRFEFQKDLAKRMILGYPAFRGKDLGENLDKMAETLADSKQFRSSFGDLNICAGSFYGPKEIEKCLNKLQKENKDFSRLKDKEVLSEIVPGPVA